MKKRLPIGIDDYKEVVEGNYYLIDKTLLIKELYEEGGKITLLPRPRRFGKTLNISMLRYFFEKTAASHAHLFTDKQIWQHDTYRAMQGTFPVISITFKDVKCTTWQESYAKIIIVLAQEIRRHKASLHGIMDEYDKEIIDKLIRQTASRGEYEDSLKFLSQLLARVYNRNVIVLLDEYDTPIHTGFVHGFYDEVVSFVRNLMGGVFKGNLSLERGVITGIMRTAKEGLFSGLNNLEVHDVLSDNFADKFGFTQGEVDQLLQDYELIQHRDDFRDWYNGYQFGKTTGIYNPWSVLNCVKQEGSFKTYWVNTSDNAIIKQLIADAQYTVKEEFEDLLNTQTSQPHELAEGIIFPDVNSCTEQALWSFLLFTGYLTLASIIKITEGPARNELRYVLKIPNREMYKLYSSLLKESVSNIISERIELLLQGLITGKDDIVRKYLQEFIINAMSMHDVPAGRTAIPERSYHLFILGMLVLLEGRYYVQSNRESGIGRYDIMLIPSNPAKDAGIVIEFKSKRERETLQEAAQKALDQIIEKKYAAQLQAKGCSAVYHYGIGFEGKELALVMG